MTTPTPTRTRSSPNGSRPRGRSRAKSGSGVKLGPAPGPRRRTRGFEVIRWIEAHCVFTNGEWIGQPFVLQPWQKHLILELFELQPADDLRRYRWALIGVPKKNGKTELAAALALYFLIADGELSPLVVCAAASEEQADLVFGAAKRMAEMSPTLRRVTDRYDKEILVPSIPGAILRRVAAVAGTNDGQNIHVVIADELHEWIGRKGEGVWQVLTNSIGARRQPMILQITTAGYDTTTILGQQYEYAAAGADARYYFRWHSAPMELNHRDEAAWREANPNYGVTVRREFFEDQLKKPESIFRRYFLNQWVATEDSWLPDGAWAACRRPELQLDASRPTWVGIDYAPRRDSTAVVIAQRVDAPNQLAHLAGQPELVPTLILRTRVWANPYPPGTAEHEGWTTNIDEIGNHLREVREAYPTVTLPADPEHRSGPVFVYDPYRFADKADQLALEGLLMLEFPQTLARLVPASETFYELILQRRIAHDGDTLLAAHIANVVKHETDRGWRMTKPKGSPKHIDAAMAAAFAVSEANRLIEQPQGAPELW